MFNPNFNILALFCDCTDRFMSDLVGNPEEQLSRVVAHMEELIKYNDNYYYREKKKKTLRTYMTLV